MKHLWNPPPTTEDIIKDAESFIEDSFSGKGLPPEIFSLSERARRLDNDLTKMTALLCNAVSRQEAAYRMLSSVCTMDELVTWYGFSQEEAIIADARIRQETEGGEDDE